MNDSQIILGLETATSTCSVALYQSGQTISRQLTEAKKSSEKIIPLIKELLDEVGRRVQEIEAIAVGVGPGSFTGVRVAVGLAKAMAFSLQVPVWPVSTLRALARQVWTQQSTAINDPVLAIWDARMQAVYWGLYGHGNGMIENQHGPDGLCAPSALQLPLVPGQTVWVVGNGFSQYQSQLSHIAQAFNLQIIENITPSAEDIIALAMLDQAMGLKPADIFSLCPEYIRNDVACVSKKSAASRVSSKGLLTS